MPLAKLLGCQVPISPLLDDWKLPGSPMSCRLARVGFGLAPSLSRALPYHTPTGCAALWLLFFRERETLTRLFGGPQQHLGAAVQTNVFRGGHDHRSLRAGLHGTNGETFKPEDAPAVGG
jgi:hypothetical protein